MNDLLQRTKKHAQSSMTTVPFFALIVKILSQQKRKQLTEALKQVILHPLEEYYNIIILKKKEAIFDHI